jgi:hypothetical protein
MESTGNLPEEGHEMTIITTRQLNSIKPKLSPFFLRDSKVTGFGVKVNPAGSIKFTAEVRHGGEINPKNYWRVSHTISLSS